MNFLRSVLRMAEGAPAAAAPAAAPAAPAAAPATLFTAAPAAAPAGTPAAPAGTPPATPPAGTPPAAAPAATNFWTSAVDETGNFKTDWTNTLPDDLKPAAETLKNYKSPAEAFRALHSTKQLLGAKGNTVPVPGPNSKPEEITAFRKALGVPDAPEGYEFVKPADAPADLAWSDDAAKNFASIMHKHHIPKAAAHELMQAELAAQKQSVEQSAAAEKQFLADGLLHLRGEWGQAFDANMAKAHSMIGHLGLTPEHPALAFPEVVKALFRAHTIISSEDGRIQGQSMVGNDPATEAKRIQTDDTHAMYKAYHAGEATAVAHVRALNEQASKAQKQ